ncbi:GNAT family N-acetyltransferase [Streptacidiphilus cavernicola]|uniref:GNAT family N-acetyltransferase n=1 Tax=Streptacidiphilus cavernicola TaxID=3342716 RepID=A0ABV6VZQ3_9ACTN
MRAELSVESGSESGTGLSIRQIGSDDWESIAELESQAYAALGLSEQRDALESRAEASPGTCFVLAGPAQRPAVAGYLLALPYPRFRYPGLGEPEQTAFAVDNLHLHDLVVARELRRRGLAGRLLGHLEAVARTQRRRHLSLVAVAGSDGFWSRHGFAPQPGVAAPLHYGPGAVYMSKPLGTSQPLGDAPGGTPSQHCPEGD